MVTEAQKRATAKYEKESVRQFIVKFYGPDADVVAWMDENGYKGSWIKSLIKREFEREQGK